MNDLIKLEDIIDLDNLSKSGIVIIVRHYHEAIEKMYNQELIEEHQSFQIKPAFKQCKYVVSFIGGERNSGRLFGVFENIGILSGKELPAYSKELEPYCIPQDRDNEFKLNLIRLDKYDKFKDRLIIDWKVPRGWYNIYGNVKSKPVIKILPLNFVKDFPGLMNVKLNFWELKKIIDNPDSHSDWYDSLTRLQAVYLILDNYNGAQYIGTTYGESGLWQRWSEYVKTNGTGGNKELLMLLKTRPDFYNDIQFSILEVLTKTADQKYCTERESNWKAKLGSKTFGLNRN